MLILSFLKLLLKALLSHFYASFSQSIKVALRSSLSYLWVSLSYMYLYFKFKYWHFRFTENVTSNISSVTIENIYPNIKRFRVKVNYQKSFVLARIIFPFSLVYIEGCNASLCDCKIVTLINLHFQNVQITYLSLTMVVEN